MGTILLLIEHNMHIVQAVAEHVCILDYGTKLADGKPKAVLGNPAMLEAYLEREASKKLALERSQEVMRTEG